MTLKTDASKSISFRLPTPLHNGVRAKVGKKTSEYRNTSEYLIDLVRKDLKRKRRKSNG